MQGRFFYTSLFVLILTSLYAQESVTLNRAAFFQVTEAQARELKKEPLNFRVEGTKVYAARGIALYRYNRHLALYPVKALRDILGKAPAKISTYFNVDSGKIPENGTYFRQICSCGVLATDRDKGCDIVTDHEGHLLCGGGCEARETGSTCRLVTQVVLADGSILSTNR